MNSPVSYGVIPAHQRFRPDSPGQRDALMHGHVLDACLPAAGFYSHEKDSGASILRPTNVSGFYRMTIVLRETKLKQTQPHRYSEHTFISRSRCFRQGPMGHGSKRQTMNKLSPKHARKSGWIRIYRPYRDGTTRQRRVPRGVQSLSLLRATGSRAAKRSPGQLARTPPSSPLPQR